MHAAPFDPRDAVDDLLRVCRLGYSHSDLMWINADAPLPAHVTVRTRGTSRAWPACAEPCGAARTQADRSFFCHVLQNLVTNALKFEEGRGVTIAVHCLPLPEAAAREEAPPNMQAGSHDASAATAEAVTHTLEVTVTDRGRGLTAEECERVFAAYEAASVSSGGGSGLGAAFTLASAIKPFLRAASM